eukprot:COSAG01_NODE_8143_length_2906_cov_1.440328_3_plen_143_part_00
MKRMQPIGQLSSLREDEEAPGSDGEGTAAEAGKEDESEAPENVAIMPSGQQNDIEAATEVAGPPTLDNALVPPSTGMADLPREPTHVLGDGDIKRLYVTSHATQQHHPTASPTDARLMVAAPCLPTTSPPACLQQSAHASRL